MGWGKELGGISVRLRQPVLEALRVAKPRLPLLAVGWRDHQPTRIGVAGLNARPAEAAGSKFGGGRAGHGSAYYQRRPLGGLQNGQRGGRPQKPLDGSPTLSHPTIRSVDK